MNNNQDIPDSVFEIIFCISTPVVGKQRPEGPQTDRPLIFNKSTVDNNINNAGII